ncbi:MAG: type I DNA topoisomerase, partial [Alphaproteobacteria bacterium]|nr:type I DNA topoisomerase [Alphaproteobacteria bacterium]
MKVVIVESPAKAKTINKYLGDDYHVIASVGHIRDLPPKDGSVDPEQDFAMKWQISSRSNEPVSQIKKAVKGASRLILATDPDREGEAISWHVHEVLNQSKALNAIPVERVVFNEITKTAILDAMAKPRQINDELVDAYLARRALDYLVGFSISPVLWRKLPGARSAGRVQSVALKLICEREAEIEAFKADEYWTIEARLKKEDGKSFSARLTHLDGQKLGKLTINNEAMAMDAVNMVNSSRLQVGTIETKRTRRNPQPPFTTSTMQQEASRKLGFSASRTMRVAQKLYEGINIGTETTGLITYMRTDGVQLGQEAITDIRSAIVGLKGERYLPSTPRIYKSRAANAQEAHEAIRPTSIMRKPEDVARFLDDDQRKLYDLIWKRTIASQMQSAELDKTAADFVDGDGKVPLRGNGSVIVFDGFLSVYREDRDDRADQKTEIASDEDDTKLLPPLSSGEPLDTIATLPEQLFTQPPPRFTDASLVKRMEELGIGRPSTYASILSVLQDRNYVEKDRGRYIPEDRGRIVSAFLESFFARYVEYDFTARLEDDLDRVSDGQLNWKDLLEKDDVLLEQHFFPSDDGGTPIRNCKHCGDGTLGLQLGRYGAFIGCSNYPECKYTRQIGQEGDDSNDISLAAGDHNLGTDPETGLPVMVRKGPYGLYVQLGDAETKKPKRTSLPKNMDVAGLDLAKGLALLNLPREVGIHPTSGEMIAAGIGRYGPFLRFGGAYVSIPADDTVISIGLNHAVEVIDTSGKTAGRNLGTHQLEGGNSDDIKIKSGRFGPYVEHDGIRATIPKRFDPETLTFEEAVELIIAKKAKGPAKPRGKKAAKKAATKTKANTTAKKAATKTK